MTTAKIYADGFQSLAAFIASDPDRTAGIFKRFDRLAARNLLNIQAELAELQAQLDIFDNEDQISKERLQSLRNWSVYKKRQAEDPARQELMRKIKETIKDYREALLFESTLAAIPPPDRKTLKAFREVFFHGRLNDPDSFPTLGGSTSIVYNDPNDLVAVHHLQDLDRLTVFVRDHFGYFFKHETPTDGTDIPIVGYASGQKLSTFVGYLSAILAALLLFGSILVFIQNHFTRGKTRPGGPIYKRLCHNAQLFDQCEEVRDLWFNCRICGCISGVYEWECGRLKQKNITPTSTIWRCVYDVL